jgi:hypothetical protein
VTTPQTARRDRLDYIVVGRPITAADDPRRRTGAARPNFWDEEKAALPPRADETAAQKQAVAKDLLAIGAVFLRPNEPFILGQRHQEPDLHDNRLTLSTPL